MSTTGYTKEGTDSLVSTAITQEQARANNTYVPKGSAFISLPFSYAGTIATYVGTNRWYNDTGRALSIISIRASLGTAPTGSSAIVDVNKNGTTLFTTQSNRPTIAANGNTAKGTIVASGLILADGDYLTVDIDQIGSTVAGADLVVQVLML